jgi:3D (Asp-Asp-Asp) domain-containing protein
MFAPQEEVVTVLAEPPPRYITVTANCSAYTSSDSENDGYGGLTCEEKPLEEGMIAMDDYPLGTKVEIDGKMYYVADRFGGGYKNRIDIFMPSKSDALRFGRQWKEVKIYVGE